MQDACKRIVVRRIPRNYSEDDFKNLIGNDWFHKTMYYKFCPAHPDGQPGEGNTWHRAYFTFKEHDVPAFTDLLKTIRVPNPDNEKRRQPLQVEFARERLEGASDDTEPYGKSAASHMFEQRQQHPRTAGSRALKRILAKQGERPAKRHKPNTPSYRRYQPDSQDFYPSYPVLTPPKPVGDDIPSPIQHPYSQPNSSRQWDMMRHLLSQTYKRQRYFDVENRRKKYQKIRKYNQEHRVQIDQLKRWDTRMVSQLEGTVEALDAGQSLEEPTLTFTQLTSYLAAPYRIPESYLELILFALVKLAPLVAQLPWTTTEALFASAFSRIKREKELLPENRKPPPWMECTFEPFRPPKGPERDDAEFPDLSKNLDLRPLRRRKPEARRAHEAAQREKKERRAAERAARRALERQQAAAAAAPTNVQQPPPPAAPAPPLHQPPPIPLQQPYLGFPAYHPQPVQYNAYHPQVQPPPPHPQHLATFPYSAYHPR